MRVRQHIDAALWPYLSRRWLYILILTAVFLAIIGAAFLRPLWQTLSCDVGATVVVLMIMDSRDRYTIWRNTSRLGGSR